MTVALGVLVALLIYREWFWSRETHRLLDKLMSRNYAEYAQVSNPPETPNRVKLPFEPQEDLGTLSGFGPL